MTMKWYYNGNDDDITRVMIFKPLVEWYHSSKALLVIQIYIKVFHCSTISETVG